MTLSSLVRGEKPDLIFTNPTVNSFAVMCWVLKDQMLKKVSTGLDQIACGDKEALGEAQRAEMLAALSSDSLEVHRRICALIWAAETLRGEIIDFAADTPPEAVLGLALRTVPRANPSPGTSPEHAIAFAGVRR